jgi:hypothetical protein
MSLLTELHEAASRTWVYSDREKFLAAAHDLAEAIDTFYLARDAASLKVLKCMWARGMRLKPGPFAVRA